MAKSIPTDRHAMRAPVAWWRTSISRQKARGLLALIVLCGGCSGRASSRGPEPIAECQEYQQALGRCLGHSVELPIASAPIGQTKEQIASTRELCAANIRQLKVTCR